MNVTTVGIDLAKSVFAICEGDSRGHAGRSSLLKGGAFLKWLRTLPAGTIVAMEACSSAQRWVSNPGSSPPSSCARTERTSASRTMRAMLKPCSRHCMPPECALSPSRPKNNSNAWPGIACAKGGRLNEPRCLTAFVDCSWSLASSSNSVRPRFGANWRNWKATPLIRRASS